MKFFYSEATTRKRRNKIECVEYNFRQWTEDN